MNRRGSWNHIASTPVNSADADNRNVLHKVFFLMYNNENGMKREREAGLVEGVKSEACRTNSLTASQGDVILNTYLEKKGRKCAEANQ